MSNEFVLENLKIYSDESELLNCDTFTIPLKSTTLFLSDNSQTLQYLIKAIGGIRIPDSGNIYLGGYNVFDINNNVENIIKKRISYVFENGALISNLNIEQNLILTLDFHFPKESYDKKIRRIKAFLQDFELDIDINLRPYQLKIEQIKLLGFIRALLSEPDIIIYDEPFRYTDSNTKKLIIRKLNELKANLITQIIKTQFNEDFVRHCDLIYYIKAGKLVFSGSIKDFIDSQTDY